MDNGVTLPLKLSNIKIIKVEEDERGDVIIYLETTEEGVNCRLCGNYITYFHSLDRPIKLRHLSAFGMNTYIIYQPRRYRCENCDQGPTTTATPEWHKSNSSQTYPYEQHILLELINSTLADVSLKEKLTEELVMGIVDRHIEAKVDWSSIHYLGVIGMDEIALKKGYRNFVTIITSRVNGNIRLLAVLNGRKKATIKGFLRTIPVKLKKTVECFCTDMYDGYISAIKSVFKKSAIIVIDRYHVAKLYRGELDKYRQKILRQLKQELSFHEYEKIKNVTAILRKTNECLTKEEKNKLNELFSYSPELLEAYRLALQLTQVFNTQCSKEEALQKFDAWVMAVKKSKLSCFNKFLKTLKKYKNEIASYFIDRQTSSFVEGLNNKIKVLKRRCYGIFNLNRLFQRLHLDISGYVILLGKSAC